MADILIKIPDEIISFVNINGFIPQKYIRDVSKAMLESTPLPKGHGRLIDADKLHHCECKGNFSECDTCLDDDLCNLVNEAPTIIEADKAESEDKR